MTYKNKCLKALNSEDFFIKSRDNQFYAKTYKDYGDILLDNFSTAYVYTSKDNKSEPKTRILSIIIYDKKLYEKDCKAHEISSINSNKIFSTDSPSSLSTLSIKRPISLDSFDSSL